MALDVNVNVNVYTIILLLLLLTAPRGGSTAAPDKFCAFVSIDSVVRKQIQSLEFSCQRSLPFGFCQFLAALGISSCFDIFNS